MPRRNKRSVPIPRLSFDEHNCLAREEPVKNDANPQLNKKKYADGPSEQFVSFLSTVVPKRFSVGITIIAGQHFNRRWHFPGKWLGGEREMGKVVGREKGKWGNSYWRAGGNCFSFWPLTSLGHSELSDCRSRTSSLESLPSSVFESSL